MQISLNHCISAPTSCVCWPGSASPSRPSMTEAPAIAPPHCANRSPEHYGIQCGFFQTQVPRSCPPLLCYKVLIFSFKINTISLSLTFATFAHYHSVIAFSFSCQSRYYVLNCCSHPHFHVLNNVCPPHLTPLTHCSDHGDPAGDGSGQGGGLLTAC